MNHRTVVAAVEAGLSETLHRPVSGLSDETRLFEDLHLDSTTSLELLMAMEDAFGLLVDPESLDMDDFRTVGTFAAFVLRELTAQQGEEVRP
ncbi:phosphopantetheine-binding protein [Streptomyces sp. NBC_01335]|uniref:acyl carrier protein n=1 Tax=Streptomyces sp. NBC_01335 TaxID=2903828 RepID=UPI002E159414|nr:phosphopantetheine-binding protein [Streptomyces sp. NBC_01335]